MHHLNAGCSQHSPANPLCPLFTLFGALSPSLSAGDLMSKSAGKREATTLALPPYSALSPKVPSPLLLGGQRGSLPPWVQGPHPASPALLRPFLVLFSHTTSPLFQGHPECFTRVSPLHPPPLPSLRPHQPGFQPHCTPQPLPVCLTSSGHHPNLYLLASLSSRMLSGFSTYSQAAPHRPPCWQPGLVP